MNEDQQGQPFSDVNPSTAPPAAKPVIPSGTPQPDPMLAARPAMGRPVELAPQAQQPSSMVGAQMHDPRAATPTLGRPVASEQQHVQSAPEATHDLQSQAPIFGEVRKPIGKKVLTTILVLLLLGGLGYGGWWYWQKQTNQGKSVVKKTEPKTETKDTAKDADTTKLFTSKFAGFSVENSNGWKVTEEETTKDYAGMGVDNATYSKVTFTINDKQFLIFNANPGGRGGDCQPKATDKPFQKTNVCQSFAVTVAEKLPQANFAKGSLDETTKDVFLTKYKYMDSAQSGDTAVYNLVGLSPSRLTAGTNKVSEPEVGVEVMGAYAPLTILGVKNGYIDIQIVDKDSNVTQLSDADLAKVEALLKTFKLQ